MKPLIFSINKFKLFQKNSSGNNIIIMDTKLGLFLCLLFCVLSLSSTAIDCTANGTREECPTACPETCKSANSLCTHECGGHCVCKKGYIIDTSIPACVLRADCPAGVVQTDGRETELVHNFPNFGKG